MHVFVRHPCKVNVYNKVDCCLFVLQVIQPVFNLMAEQVCLMGDMGESPALRLGFDDFNESACMPQVSCKAPKVHVQHQHQRDCCSPTCRRAPSTGRGAASTRTCMQVSAAPVDQTAMLQMLCALVLDVSAEHCVYLLAALALNQPWCC